MKLPTNLNDALLMLAAFTESDWSLFRLGLISLLAVVVLVALGVALAGRVRR